ncbi:MAG: hypothetical protein AAFX99_06475 [Myxococcota bacterium]
MNAQPIPSHSPTQTPSPEGDTSPKQTAQANVERARRLARLQRYSEAILLAEEAYLVLDDPELLRLLGTWHLATASYARAIGLFDAYLANPTVDAQAKAAVRLQRDEAVAALEQEHKDNQEKDLAQENPGEGEDGWRFSESGGGNAAGRIYLMLGGQLTQNTGSTFTADVSEGTDDVRQEEFMWSHGGVGVRFEAGAYVARNVGVGLSLSNDWMNWEHRAPTLPFQTVLYGGVRPELAINGRYFWEAGFFLGLSLGGDLMWLTEGSSYQEVCAQSSGAGCVEGEDVVIDDGVQGWRLMVGPIAGYRAKLAEDWTIGLETQLRYVPLFIGRTDLVKELPSFTDGSFMFNFAAVVHTNL